MAADMNTPDRHDYYVMQLTATLKAVNNTAKGKRFDPNDERLKFKTSRQRSGAPDRLQTEVSKVVGLAILGAGAEHRTRTREEAIELGLIPADAA